MGRKMRSKGRGRTPSDDSPVEEIFAFNLRARRTAKGWTQKELAGFVGMSPAMIEHLEGGRRWVSLESIRSLARALDCKTWEFFKLPSSPHFEQFTWQHAREVLDREFERLSFLNSLPVGLVEELVRLANSRSYAAIEERVQSISLVEKKPEYQAKARRSNLERERVSNDRS